MAWKKKDDEPISTKQVSSMSFSDRNIFIQNKKTISLLKDLCDARTNFEAVDVIISKTPDGKMAFNTYLRLANQGIKVELRNANTGKIVKKYDNELREFAKYIGRNNSSGLDGLIDELHASAIARSGMAVEVVVNSDATDVEEVVIIDPASIVEWKWLDNEKRYAAYQNNGYGQKVDLYEGNFFWVPHQPKPGRPDGTLQFEPAITTMTQFYQLIQDSMVVLNRIGFPRYICEILTEKLLATAMPSQKNTAEAQRKLYQQTFDMVEANLRSIGKDNDIITFDTNHIEVLGGGMNGSGIDVRAWFEVMEPLVVNSFQLTPVLLGRLKSGSYSLGTAEYSIVVDTIDTMRRASKRILEEIINMWARVRGYNVRATVTHNPIDWQTEIEKLEAQLKTMEKARRAEEYRWISHDEAAQNGIGVEKASVESDNDMYEYLKHEEKSTEEIVTEEIEPENSVDKDSVEAMIVKNALLEMGFGAEYESIEGNT